MPSWTFSNAPSEFSASGDRISFTTLPKTDYWHPPDRIAANGHFYYTKATLPLAYGLHVQASLQGQWATTYDQAGIMIRESSGKWIKAGVEYVKGRPYLRYLATLNCWLSSSVVSNPLSDWAIQPYPVNGPLTLRLSAPPGRHAKLHIEYLDGNQWIPFREITGWVFEQGRDYEVGIMACSPGDKGVRVEFWDIIAQDYSELAYQKGIVDDGGINPNLHPERKYA